ncbi:MAG: DUF3604 domain-containing protein, partial [Deltaproteobacteria bacterium]|nr:DUF3604 domain-containing protein [Deltaproteobacteria bacterium]
MKKIVAWTIGIVLVLGTGVGWYQYQKLSSRIIRITPEFIRELNQAVAAQDETAFKIPEPRQRTLQAPNPLKNVYFGDLHVHTALSFDSYLFGNRVTLDEAYRFAHGEMIRNAAGESMQITVPLDFVAITDHAESFGLFEICSDETIGEDQREFCNQFENPSTTFYWKLRKKALNRPPRREAVLCGEDGAICFEQGKNTWATIQKAAEKYNQPGVFTAFNAYEYSPVIRNGGMLHRNVIFRNPTVPNFAVSFYDAPTVLDLWRILEETCTGDCEFLTIIHNMNYSWGLSYAGETIDGDPYTTADWSLRGRSEPLAEIFQIKGSSEAAFGVGATDEDCAFEQFFPPCEADETGKCIPPNSMARDGLKRGLELKETLGFNPLQFGFIGATDTHNGNPGDTEEWDFRGQNALYSAPAKKRLTDAIYPSTKNPGGLTCIWAEENTRDALFD